MAGCASMAHGFPGLGKLPRNHSCCYADGAESTQTNWNPYFHQQGDGQFQSHLICLPTGFSRLIQENVFVNVNEAGGNK